MASFDGHMPFSGSLPCVVAIIEFVTVICLAK